ncbi:RPA-interacting protein A-like isoform X2 [Tachypleus tridentatus]|uniref:RPA-interacting protein A-like isoform X2 n=1 Tax=Tachypleus tridentatus TaxID=6853 RepID=UPI003FD5F23F
MQKRITSNAMESLALRKSSCKVKSPPWKETFRKCCSEGLKKRRQKLFDRFRQLPQSDDLEDNCSHSYRRSFEMLVEEVIKEEWYVFKGSQRRLSLQLSEGQNSEALEESNEVKDIWKQIQEELVMEEQNHLRKLDTEEAEQYGFEVLRTDEVICPVCQRFSLTQAGSVIFCLCGLQVDTETVLPCTTFNNNWTRELTSITTAVMSAHTSVLGQSMA